MSSHEEMNAPTIDDLIETLKALSEKGYGDCTWYGWDDGSLVIEPEYFQWIEVHP